MPPWERLTVNGVHAIQVDAFLLRQAGLVYRLTRQGLLVGDFETASASPMSYCRIDTHLLNISSLSIIIKFNLFLARVIF